MSPMLKALLAVKKSGYSPAKGAPRERLALISEAEAKMLRRLTDGRSDMTRFGIPSFYMEGSKDGNWKGSKPSDTKSTKTSSDRGGGGGSDSGSNSPSKDKGRGVSRDSPSRNDRGGGGSDSGNNSPSGDKGRGTSREGVGGLMREAQRRNDMARRAEQQNQYRSPNDFAGEDLTRTGYMADQYRKYRSPPAVKRQPVRITGNNPAEDLQNYLAQNANGPMYPDTPIPHQNPLSNEDLFNYQPGRPRDYVFAGMNQEAISRGVEAQRLFGKPITVTSGYRNPFQNKKAKGADDSQHMQGRALDFAVEDDGTGEETGRFIQAMKDAGYTGIGGYRAGKVHGDIGPERAWGPNYHANTIKNLPDAMQKAINAPANRVKQPSYQPAPTYQTAAPSTNHVPRPQPKPQPPQALRMAAGTFTQPYDETPMPTLRQAAGTPTGPYNRPAPAVQRVAAGTPTAPYDRLAAPFRNGVPAGHQTPRPTVAPQPQRPPVTDTGQNWFKNYAPQGLQDVVAQAPEVYKTYTKANQKINKIGGKRVQNLGGLWQALQGDGRHDAIRNTREGGGTPYLMYRPGMKMGYA